MIALLDLPIGYYTFVRLTCGPILLFLAYHAFTSGRIRWAWGYGLLGLLYNPFLPIYLGDKGPWAFINVGTIACLLIDVWRSRKRKNDSPANSAEQIGTVIKSTEHLVIGPIPGQQYGRIGRLRFLGHLFFFCAFLIVASALVSEWDSPSKVKFKWLIALVIAFTSWQTAFSIARLHDIGRSEWYALAGIVPIANLLFWCLLLILPGAARSNIYGSKGSGVLVEGGKAESFPEHIKAKDSYVLGVSFIFNLALALAMFSGTQRLQEISQEQVSPQSPSTLPEYVLPTQPEYTPPSAEAVRRGVVLNHGSAPSYVPPRPTQTTAASANKTQINRQDLPRTDTSAPDCLKGGAVPGCQEVGHANYGTPSPNVGQVAANRESIVKRTGGGSQVDCVFKPVMSDDDYHYCGIDPP